MSALSEIPTDAQSPELARLRDALDEAARKKAGFSYATYVRLKISGVVDRYARTACGVCDLPPDSTHALLTRSALRRWAEERNLFAQRIEPSPEQLDFLVTFDQGHGERRLRFVIDGLNHLYEKAGTEGYPEREQIDAAKARLWEAVGTLRDAMAGTGFDDTIRGSFETCFAVDAMRAFMQRSGFDSDLYVREHRKELDELELALRAYLKERLSGFTADLYVGLLQLTKGWNKERRWDLLVRYLGFPFWDVLLYPVQALSDVGERDQVEIVRLSPRDAHRIPVEGDGTYKKLVGAEKGHFGAFLSRPGRERDYLWGRLDGAERFLGILLEDADEADVKRWCDEAFLAILEEDEQAVPKAADLVRHVRETVGS